MKVDGEDAPLEAPLGERREEYQGLPASWRAAVARCPWCAASPGCRHDGSECWHCGGSGDLLGTMLLDAYKRGRDHVVARLKEVERVRQNAVRKTLEEEPSRKQLRKVMGL